jgi:hypothetical protein
MGELTRVYQFAKPDEWEQVAALRGCLSTAPRPPTPLMVHIACSQGPADSAAKGSLAGTPTPGIPAQRSFVRSCRDECLTGGLPHFLAGRRFIGFATRDPLGPRDEERLFHQGKVSGNPTDGFGIAGLGPPETTRMFHVW